MSNAKRANKPLYFDGVESYHIKDMRKILKNGVEIFAQFITMRVYSITHDVALLFQSLKKTSVK